MIRSIRDEYDDAEWVDASSVGSPFELQLNQRTGQWRHRPRPTPGMGARRISLEGEWTTGQPKKVNRNG